MKIKTILILLFVAYLVVGCHTSGHISVGGKIVAEAIYVATHTPAMRDGKMFALSGRLNSIPSLWKAPKGYTLTKFNLDSFSVEFLESTHRSDKVILLLHGGSYLIKLQDIYRNLAVKYSELGKGASVLLVDYRVAPQYTFPAALIDAVASWNWLVSRGYKPENIMVVGDSAGGNLALSLVMKLRDQGDLLPAAMICMSPWTDLASEGASYRYNRYKDPVFGEIMPKEGMPEKERIIYVSEYAGNTDLHDKYLSPAFGDYQQFPPLLIQVGTNEVLESDAITVYDKAKAAGVNATLTRYPEMFHVFQLVPGLPEAKLAWWEVGHFISQYLDD